jgi:hypothetical protein
LSIPFRRLQEHPQSETPAGDEKNIRRQGLNRVTPAQAAKKQMHLVENATKITLMMIGTSTNSLYFGLLVFFARRLANVPQLIE